MFVGKSEIKTVRFSAEESEHVDKYLALNPVFEGFSSLARIATLSFISQAQEIPLQTLPTDAKRKRPTFLWDYDLNEVQVREILGKPGLSPPKKWLIERILVQARFDEITHYLNLKELKRLLPRLKLPSRIYERWAYALNRWYSHEE